MTYARLRAGALAASFFAVARFAGALFAAFFLPPPSALSPRLFFNAAIVAYLLYVRLSRTGRAAEDAIHRTEAEKKAEKVARKKAKAAAP